MTRKPVFRWTLALVVVLVVSGQAAAQQPHAPAGGIYVNGRFYAGGQFIPRGTPGGVFGPSEPSVDWGSLTDPLMAPLPMARRSARRSARAAYRAEARESANGSGPDRVNSGESADEVARSKSGISTAKNLIKLGKFEEARGWLIKVIEMKTSVAIVQEARKLLGDVERRTGRTSSMPPSGERYSGSPEGDDPRSKSPKLPTSGKTARAVLEADDPQSGSTATANPTRYFAQISLMGPIRYRQITTSINVLGASDSTGPIGMALQSGSTDDGQAIWGLIVRGSAVPGRFILVDREFRRLKE
jgi:hypothetical protein